MAEANKVSLRLLLSRMPIKPHPAKAFQTATNELNGKLPHFPAPIRLSTPKDTGQMGKMSFYIRVWFRVKAKLRRHNSDGGGQIIKNQNSSP